MNEKLQLKTSPLLRITRIIVVLIYLFLIFCAIEAIRGDFVGLLELRNHTNHGIQTICGEVMSWL